MEYPIGGAFCSLSVRIYPISITAQKGGIKALFLLRTAYIADLGLFYMSLSKIPQYKAYVFYPLTRPCNKQLRSAITF
jgi:hypothetical protein